ncbi:hypothetical protein Plec18170_004439 [Paecilomyces lecythidis]
MHNNLNARAIIHHSYYWLERKARRVSRASHPPEEISQDAQIEKVCRDKQQFHNVVDFFGLRPGSYKLHTQWALDEEDTYEIPNILEPMLDDFDTSCSFQGLSIRSQVNTVITLAISHAKKREARRTCAPLPGDKDYRSYRDPLAQIHTRQDQVIRTWFPYRGKRYRMSGMMDYVLWYGSREELETNLIIYCARSLGDIDLSVLFSYMGTIHHARNRAGSDAALYGIYSDRYHWTFVYLDNFGRYTVRILNWATSKQEIFTYITHIVEDAIYRMQIDPDSDSEEDETASEIARCYITDAEWDDKFDHLHARN